MKAIILTLLFALMGIGGCIGGYVLGVPTWLCASFAFFGMIDSVLVHIFMICSDLTD